MFLSSKALLLRSASVSSAVARSSLPARRGRVTAASAVAASRAPRSSPRPRIAISLLSSSPLPSFLPPLSTPSLSSSSSARSLRTTTTAPRSLASAAAAVAMSSSSESEKKNKKRVLVPIADGTEEMEAVIVADVLRRAGAEVTLASVEEKGERREVVCSRGVRIVADASISEVDKSDLFFDAVVLPGGMPGAERLRDCERLSALLERHRSKAAADADASSSSSSSPSGIILAAICAAPQVVFDAPGRRILDGRKATAHPAFSSKLRDPAAAGNRVVVDGNVVTSRGPGTAFEFSLCLVERLFGTERAEEVAGPMVMADGAEEPLVVGG